MHGNFIEKQDITGDRLGIALLLLEFPSLQELGLQEGWPEGDVLIS